VVEREDKSKLNSPGPNRLLGVTMKEIPSGIYFFHEKTERLPRLVVFEAELLGLFHYRPVTAVVGKVKVAGVDVRKAKRRAAEVSGIVNIGQDVTAKVVLSSRVQIDSGRGALNNISANCSECHFALKVKSEE
jgi:hypothetical protein